MERYEFMVPGTIFIAVNASSMEEARQIAGYDLGHAIDLPHGAGRAAQYVSVIPDGDGALVLNTISGREDWDESEDGQG